jgi:hypothetical protein
VAKARQVRAALERDGWAPLPGFVEAATPPLEILSAKWGWGQPAGAEVGIMGEVTSVLKVVGGTTAPVQKTQPEIAFGHFWLDQ